MAAEKGPEAARPPRADGGAGAARSPLLPARGCGGLRRRPGARRAGGGAGRGSPARSGSAPSRRGGPGEGRGSGTAGAALRERPGSCGNDRSLPRRARPPALGLGPAAALATSHRRHRVGAPVLRGGGCGARGEGAQRPRDEAPRGAGTGPPAAAVPVAFGTPWLPLSGQSLEPGASTRQPCPAREERVELGSPPP